MDLNRLFEKYIDEALPLSVAKKYTAMRELDSKHLTNLWKKLIPLSIQQSKRQDRLYFEFESKSDDKIITSPVYDEVSKVLSSQGLTVGIDDYIEGKVKDKYGRDAKLGKILAKNAPALLQKFNNDKIRQSTNTNKKSLICISKHPYDIAGMSTDRGWTSCMNLEGGGGNCRYIGEDIKYNTLIAYLIKEDDLNINRPQARVVIKPLINVNKNDDSVLYLPGNKMYGTAPQTFMKEVAALMKKAQADVYNRFSKYSRNSNLYNDNDWAFREIVPNGLRNKSQVIDILTSLKIKNYKINDDFTVDVDGDCNISNKMITYIPVYFGTVTGNFDCSHNQIISLEGAPKNVGGNFQCSYNSLTNLTFAPTTVGGNFYCSKNKLQTLEDSPKEVGGHFYCSVNELKSLNGAPQKAGKDFDCSDNNLITLEGAPDIIFKDFVCAANKLTSLKGAPKEVRGSFVCLNNKLTTLEGAPSLVGEDFICYANTAKFQESDVIQYSEVKGEIVSRFI